MKYSDLKNPEQVSAEMKRRIIANEPWPNNAGFYLLPYEPIVIVDEPILPFTNYRAIQKEGKYIIPVALYNNDGSRQYASLEDCKKWAEIYGIDNLLVDKLSNYTNTENI